jgi:hypothetical protein
MERLIQTAKEGAECLDSYFPRRKGHRRLNHVKAWLNVHSVYYNLVRRRASLEVPPHKPTGEPEYTTLQTIAAKIKRPLT